MATAIDQYKTNQFNSFFFYWLKKHKQLRKSKPLCDLAITLDRRVANSFECDKLCYYNL